MIVAVSPAVAVSAPSPSSEGDGPEIRLSGIAAARELAIHQREG